MKGLMWKELSILSGSKIARHAVEELNLSFSGASKLDQDSQ
jgi:hypothetical protein